MIDFIKTYWSEILSIIAAAAWLPIMVPQIINHFRKIHTTVLESHILTNGKGISAFTRKEKNGTILMLVMNLFVKNTTVFAHSFSIKVRLKNGATMNAELLDFSTLTSNNDDGSKSCFNVPIEHEFNIARTVHPNVDNIKCMSLLVERY